MVKQASMMMMMMMMMMMISALVSAAHVALNAETDFATKRVTI